MRCIIEMDGAVFDLRSAWYQAYREAAAQVGWSRLEEAEYWRMTRTRGREAIVLPGAKPAKLKAFVAEFERRVETDAIVEALRIQPGVERALTVLRDHGPCSAVTLGLNVGRRRHLLEQRGLSRFFDHIEGLSSDLRRRPGELALLSGGDRRTMVAASGDGLTRAAGGADLFAAGIASGACTPARLHQAGADVVFPELAGLAESLAAGAADLVRAGLLPAGLD